MRAVRGRRGVALVLVLWVLVILGGIAAGVVGATRTAGDATTNLRARAVGRYMAESGIVAAVHAVDRALLAAADDSAARRTALNALDRTIAGVDSLALGEGVAQVAVIDASARLDVNAATEAQLAALFARTGSPVEAPVAARAIRAYVDGDAQGARLLRSLDELRRIPGVSEPLARAAAPYLTVDGDGRINRVTAPPPVLAAAAGELHDEPSRLVFVSRGWQRGHPLTHEVQAVYAVQGTRLVFVHWRERDL